MIGQILHYYYPDDHDDYKHHLMINRYDVDDDLMDVVEYLNELVHDQPDSESSYSAHTVSFLSDHTDITVMVKLALASRFDLRMRKTVMRPPIGQAKK